MYFRVRVYFDRTKKKRPPRWGPLETAGEKLPSLRNCPVFEDRRGGLRGRLENLRGARPNFMQARRLNNHLALRSRLNGLNRKRIELRIPFSICPYSGERELMLGHRIWRGWKNISASWI